MGVKRRASSCWPMPLNVSLIDVVAQREINMAKTMTLPDGITKSDRTLKICNISIKNFRSIQALNIDLNDMTVISGLNDAGKSNVLKALNLFFNGCTDADRKFCFETDYCLNAPVKKKKAKTVEITLKFLMPANFTDQGVVAWTKRWYRNGTVEEHWDRTFSPMSKAGTLFQRIKFRYVPAVKSTDYFKSLLQDLYRTLSKEVDGELVKKTGEYSETIKKYTSRISRAVNDQFGVRSTLEYPEDQSAIFRELKFMTSIEQGRRVALEHRGDGVQSAHIPAILKFIAEKDNEGLARNSILCSTFWGYEEPENGLEMLKCYGLAEELRKISPGIQMLITSHSPAFFDLGRCDNVLSYWLEKDSGGFTSVKQDCDGVSALGFMPLIAPYLEDKRREIEGLKQMVRKNIAVDLDTILVEGVTDKAYLERAIRIHSPRLAEALDEDRLRFYFREDDGGTSNVVNYAKVWHLTKMHRKLVVVLDKDPAGDKAAREINELRSSSISVIRIPPAPWILRIYGRIVEKDEFPVPIETMFPEKVWNTLRSRSLLDERTDGYLNRCFAKLMGKDSSLVSVLDKYIEPQDRIYVEMIPHPDKKKSIQDCVLKMAKEDCSIFDEFKKIVETIESKLSSKS